MSGSGGSSESGHQAQRNVYKRAADPTRRGILKASNVINIAKPSPLWGSLWRQYIKGESQRVVSHSNQWSGSTGHSAKLSLSADKYIHSILVLPSQSA